MLKLLKMNYHPQLIDMMAKSVFTGAFSVNILTPFLLAYILHNNLSYSYVQWWLILNIVIFVARVLLGRSLSWLNQQGKDVNIIFHSIMFVMFLSALLHAYALWYLSFHVSDTHLFFVATITVALVSGSISTLSSIYHAFASFVIFNLVPIILILSFTGGEMFYIFSFAVFTFMFAMLRSGHNIHLSLKENIELKESFEKRVEESILELKDKEKLLQRQSRLAQMGEMISMIAHQWRQPLNAISATSSSISLQAKLNKLENDYAIEMSDNISEYTQHLSDTIDDFRNFFKPNKDKSETSYNELLESVVKMIEPSLLSNNITLIQELECRESFISYPNELKQVILNLLKNAEDVLIEKKIENALILIQTRKEGKKMILELSDNAGGISNKIIDKIFNPYFSTKKQKDGSGLGLYMSKLIIEEHCSGELSVKNTKDGALFRVVLGEF